MTKRIPIILLLMAVLIVAVPYAHAQNYTTWQKGVCTQAQQNAGWCFAAPNFLIQIQPDVNGNWPTTNYDGSGNPLNKQYQYLITPTCKGSVPLLESLVLLLPECNGGTSVNYIQSGAVLTSPTATACQVALNNTQLWQTNVPVYLKMNCSSQPKTLSIYASPETAPSLITMGLVATSGCQIFTTSMLGPGCLGNASSTSASTATGQGGVEVQINNSSNGATSSVSVYDPTTGTWIQSSVSYPQIWLCQSTSVNTDGSGNMNPTNCPQVVSFGGNFTIYADSASCMVINGGTGGAGSVTCIPSVDTTKAATYGCNSSCPCLSSTGKTSGFYKSAGCH